MTKYKVTIWLKEICADLEQRQEFIVEDRNHVRCIEGVVLVFTEEETASFPAHNVLSTLVVPHE